MPQARVPEEKMPGRETDRTFLDLDPRLAILSIVVSMSILSVADKLLFR